jgi:hypothetical protein
MSVDRSNLIEEIFHSALERPPSERRDYVIHAGGDDPGLRLEIESLLTSDSDATSTLDSLVAADLGKMVDESPLSEAELRVGPYRLVIIQTALVSVHRVDIHRNLGLFGFGLACAMVVLGELAAIDMLARGASPPESGLDPLTFYAIPFFGILIFGVLLYFAFKEREDRLAHKRLILIGTIAIMDAPTGRPPFTMITGHPHTESVFVYLFLLLLIFYDLWSMRR